MPAPRGSEGWSTPLFAASNQWQSVFIRCGVLVWSSVLIVGPTRTALATGWHGNRAAAKESTPPQEGHKEDTNTQPDIGGGGDEGRGGLGGNRERSEGRSREGVR